MVNNLNKEFNAMTDEIIRIQLSIRHTTEDLKQLSIGLSYQEL